MALALTLGSSGLALLKQKSDQLRGGMIELGTAWLFTGFDSQPFLIEYFELVHLMKLEPAEFRKNMRWRIQTHRLFSQQPELLIMTTGGPGGKNDADFERIKIFIRRQNQISMLILLHWAQQDMLENMQPFTVNI